MDVFAATDAERYVAEGLALCGRKSGHVAEGLGAFCDPLVDVLDEFEQQLQLSKQRLLNSIKKMQKAHADYEHQRRIDHQFVL